MASRMDRYQKEENSKPESFSRVARNQKKYEDLYTNAAYTSFSSIRPNVIDLSTPSSEVGRRESYQRQKNTSQFGETVPQEVKKYEYPVYEKENKDFDVNHILEEAKKNREVGESEEKKRLTPTEYNILVDLSEEKVAQYKKEKKSGLTQEEEQNLEELIHTITSKTMAQDLAKIMEKESSEEENSLLDDLMPTKLGESVVSGELLNEIQDKMNETVEETKETTEEEIEEEESEEKEEENEEETEEGTSSKELEDTKTEENVVDRSFYTDSMDISRSDIMRGVEKEEDELFVDDKKSRIWVKIFVLVVVLFLIVGIVFVVLQNM